jgi:hypothetical protein
MFRFFIFPSVLPGDAQVCSCDKDFEFDLKFWRRAVAPFEVPEDAPLTLALDPSFTAHETSDESSCALGWLDDTAHLHVVDIRANRWRGILLADIVVDFCERQIIQSIRVEQSPFFDLLSDAIRWRGESRNAQIPPIYEARVTTPKAQRFRRLQTTIEKGAVTLRDGSYVAPLMCELEKFCFTSPTNHRAADNRIDALCLLANFR